jgi:hypothetical protein
MEREPEWTKKISNQTVCSYYYIMFVIAAAAASLAIVTIFIIPFLKGVPPGFKLVQIIGMVIQAALALLATLASYLVCSRSLL